MYKNTTENPATMAVSGEAKYSKFANNELLFPPNPNEYAAIVSHIKTP